VIPEPEIRAALDRILSSDYFVNAERLSAFLRFTVERTLAGDGAQIKEYLLGTEVFGKGPDFDPRLDPAVRVEARRLRAKLLEYYDGPGRTDPIRILVRKGGYTPVFERVAISPSQTPRPSRAFRWAWISAALFAVAVAGTTAARHFGAGRVSILVIPSAEQPEERSFADGLGQALTGELSRNSRLRVVAWPKFAEYRQSLGQPGTILIREAAKDLGAEIVVALNVRRHNGNRDVFAALMRPSQGYKEWFQEYERGSGDEFAIQRELAKAMAEEIGRKIAP
jgi:TolB-like protein